MIRTSLKNLFSRLKQGPLLLLGGLLLLSGIAPWACQKGSTPTAVTKASGSSLGVALPLTKEIQTSLLGSTVNEVWYSVSGPNMAPVTGNAGPFTVTSNTGELDFTIGLYQGPSRLLAFQLNNASNHQPLAIGAVMANIDATNTAGLWVTMGSVSRSVMWPTPPSITGTPILPSRPTM